MALPSTGGTWAQVLQPDLNPLNVDYFQITDILAKDYDPTGQVWNAANAAVGLGVQGLFTPFAADNLTIRKDLLVAAGGSNQGFYHIGLLKEDSVSITHDQTMQQTPSAQLVRTSRNVLTKLDDKITFTPQEESPLTRYLRYELPLAGGIPALGSPGSGQIARGTTDVPVERVLVVLGVDGAGKLRARVFPRVITDKKGKEDLGRKMPSSESELSYEILPEPYSQQTEWICYAGSQWLAAGDYSFETTTPQVTTVTGLKAHIVFPTPLDLTSPTYTVSTQAVAGGSWSSATVGSGGDAPSASGNFTTVTITTLVASQAYNALQVTATASPTVITGPVSGPFTATSS